MDSNSTSLKAAASLPDHVTRRSILAGTAGGMALLTLPGSALAQDMPIRSVPGFGQARIGGRALRFRSEVADMPMRDASQRLRATMFHASYTEVGTPPARRPVTFVFNGGPGGATWPLHVALSPRMIVKASGPSGFAVANNPESLFDVTDLVFVDAPGTGYSRFIDDNAKKEYWGVEEDGRAFLAFIRQWRDRNRRQASPIYILGESYGGTRIAQILGTNAASADPLRLAGVILVSPTLGAGGERPRDRSASRDVFSLPTQAAIARWHGKGAYQEMPVERVAERAWKFAKGDYSRALENLSALTSVERKAIANQLSRFVGLPAERIDQLDLVVPMEAFRTQLLNNGNRLVNNDGRKQVAIPPSGQQSVLQTADGFDLQDAIEYLLHNDLGYPVASGYTRDPGEVGRKWNERVNQAQNLPKVLRREHERHRAFKTMLMAGYYDMNVPYHRALTSLGDAGLPSDRYRCHVRQAGHAVYEDEADKGFAMNLTREFYRL